MISSNTVIQSSIQNVLHTAFVLNSAFLLFKVCMRSRSVRRIHIQTFKYFVAAVVQLCALRLELYALQLIIQFYALGFTL